MSTPDDRSVKRRGHSGPARGSGVPMSGRARPSVVLVTSFPRSGSTILGDVMSTFGGVTHAGEIYQLRDVHSWGKTCTCGEPFASCPVWSDILDEIDPGFPSRDSFSSQVSKKLWPVSRRDRGAGADLLASVYSLLASKTGSQVIVDSSKSIAYTRMALSQMEIPIHVVHLVRDGRAAVFSRLRAGRKKKLAGSNTARQLISVSADAFRWARTNRAARSLSRDPGVSFQTVRYEDFASAPASIVGQILSSVGIEPTDRHADDAIFEVEPQHLVWGNRGRSTGTVRIRSDERWRADMTAMEQRLIDTIAGAELQRFEYS